MSSNALAHHLTVGVIQTTLNPHAAWTNSTKMERVEEEKAIAEIRASFSALKQDQDPPDIVILPELSVPNGFEGQLRKMAAGLQSIVIAGLDYRIGTNEGEVHNDAVLIVPKKWRNQRMGNAISIRRIGKTYPAPQEERKLNSISKSFCGDSSVWLFDADEVGSFGVMVCYDFMDIERIAMYRGKVHHLFILALNQDATSFNHVAEAVARQVFCNVVICNCGFFGGSLAVSPYRFAERRAVYRHVGANLATLQVITLPVASLDMHQRADAGVIDPKEYKSLPPGYSHGTEFLKVTSVAKQASLFGTDQKR